jgi:hypothetical protein
MGTKGKNLAWTKNELSRGAYEKGLELGLDAWISKNLTLDRTKQYIRPLLGQVGTRHWLGQDETWPWQGREGT